MKKEEIFFLSRDGKTKIHAVKWIPEGKPVCILQIVHGMAEYIERYERLASVLTRQGILVTGEDHLGHGKSVGENGIYGYFCAHDPATVVVRDVQCRSSIPVFRICYWDIAWGLSSSAIT